jgi:alpha-tubulin suppressor-like RCC1 family protein
LLKHYCGQKIAGSRAAAFFKIMKTRRTYCKAGVAAPRQRAAFNVSVKYAAVCRPPLRNLIQFWLLCALLLQAFTNEALPVIQIATGSQSLRSLFLKSDGSLWGMGYNGDGGLGDGTYNNSYIPEQIVASNVTAVAAGWAHSLFLKNDGSLWAMGANQYGQLGNGGNFYDPTRPEQIVASNVTAIAAGYGHSLFLKNDGSLWAMGYNYYGQLGDGNSNWVTNRPEQILASNVTAVAAGGFFSRMMKSHAI